MSGALAALAASPSGGVVGMVSPVGLDCNSPTGNNGTSTITFNTDGSISKAVAGVGSIAGPSGPTQWAIAVQASIGTGVWVRFTATSGTFTSNAASAFTQLTSNLAIVDGPVTADKATVFTIDFSYDAGATTARTVTGNTLSVTHI